MARAKPHIRIPSVEGQLGYPQDLVERYRKGNGSGRANGTPKPPSKPAKPDAPARGSRRSS
jgi:hypothetical protein